MVQFCLHSANFMYISEYYEMIMLYNRGSKTRQASAWGQGDPRGEGGVQGGRGTLRDPHHSGARAPGSHLSERGEEENARGGRASSQMGGGEAWSVGRGAPGGSRT